MKYPLKLKHVLPTFYCLYGTSAHRGSITQGTKEQFLLVAKLESRANLGNTVACSSRVLLGKVASLLRQRYSPIQTAASSGRYDVSRMVQPEIYIAFCQMESKFGPSFAEFYCSVPGR